LNQNKPVVPSSQEPEAKEVSITSKGQSYIKHQSSDRKRNIQALAECALEHVLELKGLDAVVYEVHESSSIADYILVASGTSARHVRGIVDNVKEKLAATHRTPARIEGYQDGEWIVMDYSDIIIHIFFEPKRQHFKFDELFKDQKKMKLKDHLNTQVRAFKTGMHSLV
jgi:ribosome-associated protein